MQPEDLPPELRGKLSEPDQRRYCDVFDSAARQFAAAAPGSGSLRETAHRTAWSSITGDVVVDLSGVTADSFAPGPDEADRSPHHGA